MSCSHLNHTVVETGPFFGSVRISDQNPAAHGGVRYTEECRSCGAQRGVNANGCHEEVGEWGPPRAERERIEQEEAREAEREQQEAADQARRAQADADEGRPVPFELPCHGYAVATIDGPKNSNNGGYHPLTDRDLQYIPTSWLRTAEAYAVQASRKAQPPAPTILRSTTQVVRVIATPDGPMIEHGGHSYPIGELRSYLDEDWLEEADLYVSRYLRGQTHPDPGNPLVAEIPDGSTLLVRREDLVPCGAPEEKTPTTDRLRALIDSWRKEASWGGENKLGDDVRRCLRTCASQLERLIDDV